MPGQLMEERRSLKLRFAMFLTTYVWSSTQFLLYGNTWRLICSQ